MGRFTGVVRRLPKDDALGEIKSLALPGLTAFFDATAMKRARGPGGIDVDARVSFEIGGNGKAVNIIKSQLNTVAQATGRHRKYSPVRYRG